MNMNIIISNRSCLTVPFKWFKTILNSAKLIGLSMLYIFLMYIFLMYIV
jgi:hypothetical protein